METINQRHPFPEVNLKEKWGLGYTREAAQFVKENHVLFRKFLSLKDKLDRVLPKEMKVEETSADQQTHMALEFLWGDNLGRYYKLTIGDKNFFIKNDLQTLPDRQFGYEEFVSTKKAEDLLKDIKGVKVVKSILGYQDDKQSIFVSEWHECQRLDKYLLEELPRLFNRTRDGQKRATLLEEMRHMGIRYQAIEDLLKSQKYQDVTMDNMFYDSQSDTILVFDLSTGYKRSSV